MSLEAMDIVQWNPDIYEESRQELLERFKGVSEKLDAVNTRVSAAKEALDIFDKTMCDENIASLDVLAFVEISVFSEDVENHMFGEISKIIEDAVNSEIEEMTSAVTSQDYKRQITPSRLLKSSEIEKAAILSEEVFLEDSDKAAVTIRCMEIYNDMCLTAAAVSERTRKKQLENQQLLYIINSKYRFPEGVSENHINESVLYTVALVSAVKEGSKPGLSDYRDKMIANLNKGINALTSSKDSKLSIRVLNAAGMTLEDCKQYLEDSDNPTARNTKLTIEAIQNVYKEKTAEINQLYSTELNQ